MNYLEIKTMFKALSGRYDLVDDDTTGIIDQITKSASRYLDRLTEHQKTWGVHFEEVSAGGFKADMPYCRAVKEVWVTKSDKSKWQLEKIDLQDLVAYYSSTPSSGSPEYYSSVISRKIPEDADLTALASYLTYTDTSTSLTYEYNGIVFSPPTDETILVEIRGLFYSNDLSDNTDENHWSVLHPVLLVKAMMREIETFNQNNSKVQAWTNEIANEIMLINKDLIEENIVEIDQMEG